MADENKVVTRSSLPMNLQFFATNIDDGKNTDDDVNGEDGKDIQGKDEDQTAGASGDAGKSDKTFTQAQVTQMMAKEKRQGRAAALRELGIDPNDKKAVKMVQAILASQKNDDDGSTDNETNAKVAELETKAMKAECKAEAMVLGAKAEYVDDVIVLAMSKMDEDSDFKTIIGEIKTKYPAFFGNDTTDDKGKEEKDDKTATGKKGTGASMKNLGKDDKSEEKKSLGSRLAAQRSVAQKKGTNFIKR
jgi:hypothetical protein